MKFFWILVLLTTIASGIFAQTNFAFYEGDYDKFTKEMQQENKNYLVMYSATWCGPCKLFQRETLDNKEVAEYIQTNYAVYKVDVDKRRDLKTRNKITALPTTIVYDSKGREIYRFTSYMPPKKFMRRLKMVD